MTGNLTWASAMLSSFLRGQRCGPFRAGHIPQDGAVGQDAAILQQFRCD
jgi:hypothetical protein